MRDLQLEEPVPPERYIWGLVKKISSLECQLSDHMSGMEALQLKIDGLQWEMNRLDAENKNLRDEHPEVKERIDLATELEKAQEEVAGMAE